MDDKTVHLLDLPDEILLIIMKKLDSVDILYSLLGVNKRLDQMARSVDNSRCIDLSIASPYDGFHLIELVELGQFRAFKFDKMNRFCNEILPQIHHNVVELNLESFFMERVLLACEYPKLKKIGIVYSLPAISIDDLEEGSPIPRLFREQITHITIKVTKKLCSRIFFTRKCADLLAICTKLSYLSINQCMKDCSAQLSFYERPPNGFWFSHLRTLLIDVLRFDDCLYLLDGRLDQLSSFTVTIGSIERFSMVAKNQEMLFNLKEFSLICYSVTDAYHRRILPLLRRMSNLNSLTLNLSIERLMVIDGNHLNEKILRHMLHLNTFMFDICTIMSTTEANSFLSTNNIQNTFMNWKYSPVNCCVDHFSNGHTYCHIYSMPFKATRFMYLTNSFRDHHLECVTDLTLYDTRPFEHDFFEWISRAFPLLKYLKLNNLISQKKTCQIELVNDKEISSKISYLHLIRLGLIHAHIDYADQFLRDTNVYVPRLNTLKIQYEKIANVTNNFTNDATRLNCGQLKQLILNESVVYPEQFSHYFPSLIKGYNGN